MAASGLVPPFAWYGGKRRWVNDVWARFGRVDVYSEPFAGSAAMLLGSPYIAPSEIINDSSGFIANLWRAIRADPYAVARYADYPSYHHDLYANQIWLINWANENSQRLMTDRHFYDAEAAGLWVWGINIFIGNSQWCMGTTEKPMRELRPIVNPRGGLGVSAQSRRFGAMPIGEGDRLFAWFYDLAQRLARVVTLNRDWTSAVTPGILHGVSLEDNTLDCAIFLDPPYRTETGRSLMYQSDMDGKSEDVAWESYEWAVAHGHAYKIAYCSQVNDFPIPPNWESLTRSLGQAREGAIDQIIFSPRCSVAPQQGNLDI